MFYVKERLNKDSEISISLTENNVYNRCPRCGEEIQVNLADLKPGDGLGISDVLVLCDNCGKKVLRAKEHGDK